MSEAIPFKFKYLADDGQEAGFLSQKGLITAETLTLGKQQIPMDAVLRAQRRLNRVILTVLLADGRAAPVAFAVTSGNLDVVRKAINGITSRRWAEARRQALTGKGEGHTFATDECPYCHAIVDMTGFKASPQMYCNYCETLVTRAGTPPKGEPEFHLCDQCGYFSQPRHFTSFYFYFVFVVWGYSWNRRYVCPGCMRGDAWKMFFFNMPFLLGFPFAVVQLARVHLLDRGNVRETYAGINRANVRARKGRVKDAVVAYGSMTRNLMDSAGIRYNCGKAFAGVRDFENAATQLENALVVCNNHAPSYDLLCECYRQLGKAEKLSALRKQWGDEPAPPPLPPPLPPVQGQG